MLILKCGISACRRKTWIPVTVFIVCVAVSTVCFLTDTPAFKIPELLCFTCIVMIRKSEKTFIKLWYKKVSFFKKRGFFMFDFFGRRKRNCPSPLPYRAEPPPEGKPWNKADNFSLIVRKHDEARGSLGTRH